MTFTVTYNGNGATGGSVPVDATAYNSGDQVTVLGNTGNLSLAGGQFVYWNTAADGGGTLQGPSAKFTITGNVTLFAQWLVTDGLPNGGVTTHFTFSYDRVLANPGGPEPARTKAVMAKVEGDYNLMASWWPRMASTRHGLAPSSCTSRPASPGVRAECLYRRSRRALRFQTR